MRKRHVQSPGCSSMNDDVSKNPTPRMNLSNCPSLTHLTLIRFITSASDLNTIALSIKGSIVSKLDVSKSTGITGALSVFLSHNFPSLEHLILSDCGLNSDDLSSLVKASSEGRLPELKHLDLSDNEAIRGQWRHLFSHDHQWSHLLSLNVKQDVQFHEEYHDLVHAVQLGALPNLRHLSLSSKNVECLQKCLSVTWPSIQNLDIRSAVKHSSNEHVQVHQQVVTTVERGSLPQLHTFSVTSKFVLIDLTTMLNSLEIFCTANEQLHHLPEACSSLLNTSLSTEISEPYISYLQGLKDMNLATHLANRGEHIGEYMDIYFGSKLFKMKYHFPGDFSQQPFDLGKICSILLEKFELSDIPESVRPPLKSIIVFFCQKGQSFLDGEPLHLMPVASQLHDLLDTFDDVSPVDLSLFKSLVEIGCKNFQCALNGQPLDLQSVCPLLKEWIGRSPSVHKPVRPLLESIVDAVESVLVGNQSNYKSASSKIHEWVELVSYLPNCPTFLHSQLKFMADVFCTFLNCFFTKPLDLQPFSRLWGEWIETSSDKYIEESEFPVDLRKLKCVVEVILTFMECAFNRPFSLLPVCDVVHKWVGTSPGLSECDKSICKWLADVWCIRLEQILSGKLQTLFSVVPEVDPSLVNRMLSPDTETYLQKFSSEQLTNSINFHLLRVSKYQLRKHGIRVYTHFSVSEK